MFDNYVSRRIQWLNAKTWKFRKWICFDKNISIRHIPHALVPSKNPNIIENTLKSKNPR